jgi:hypothetical protein
MSRQPTPESQTFVVAQPAFMAIPGAPFGGDTRDDGIPEKSTAPEILLHGIDIAALKPIRFTSGSVLTFTPTKGLSPCL